MTALETLLLPTRFTAELDEQGLEGAAVASLNELDAEREEEEAAAEHEAYGGGDDCQCRRCRR